jgi:hypothetical protein
MEGTVRVATVPAGTGAIIHLLVIALQDTKPEAVFMGTEAPQLTSSAQLRPGELRNSPRIRVALNGTRGLAPDLVS